jgi:hypothetical protein
MRRGGAQDDVRGGSMITVLMSAKADCVPL